MTGKRKNYLIQGVGINDLNYTGVQNCPFYQKWSAVLRRCYSDAWFKKKPSYIGTYMSEEWKYLSNFKDWMEKEDWQGKHLDKDLLFIGNKCYSPETCIFVSPLVNSFLTDRSASRGNWPLGVTITPNNRFSAACNQLGGKRKFLGNFSTPEEAHLAWKAEKHVVACLLADMQEDQRISEALKTRYLS